MVRTITVTDCTNTGMALVLVCLLLSVLTALPHMEYAAIVLLVIVMAYPRSMTFPARCWLGFSELLGTVMSKVILTVVFFLILFPIAVLCRAFGHDPMRRSQWKQEGSAFIDREHLFAPSDLEHPF